MEIVTFLAIVYVGIMLTETRFQFIARYRRWRHQR